MAKQNINVGTTANDKKGDSLRAAFQKVNANFTELYTVLGINADVDLNLGAFEFTGSVMTTTDSSAITIDQATTITSNLSVGGDIVPQTANGGDLGSSTLPWRSLYVSNNTIYIGGVAIGLDVSNNLTVSGSRVGTTSYADLAGKPALTTVATTGAYADLTGKPTIPTLISQLANDSGFLTSVGNISNIQSEGNINIDINLSDSTLRRWQFGEDGDTVFPNNVSINYSGNNIQYPRIIADSGKAFSVQAQGTSGSAALSWTVDPDAAGQYAAVAVSRAGGDNLAKVVIQAQSNSGDDATAKTWRFDETGALTLPGDIRSDSNINIDINLTDSTLRRWQFGEDGHLTLPMGGNISEGGGFTGAIRLTPAGGANANQALLIYPTGFAEGDHIHLTAGGGSTELYLGDDDHYVKLASDGFVVIKADDGVNEAVWGFSPDGTTSIPGDIKSDSNINIEVNLSDSTLRRWSFGEDGKLTFPDGANYAGQTVTMPTTIGNTNSFVWEFSDNSIGSDRITLNWNLLASDTAGFYIGTTHSTTGKYLFLDGTDQSLSYIAGDGVPGGGKLIFGSSAGNNAGDANAIEIKATNGDVYLTSTESVKITVDAADSSARIWTFDPTGELKVPGPISGLGNDKLEFTANSGAVFSGSNGNTISIYANDGDIGGSADINIYTDTAGSSYKWTFGTDGSLTLPGEITLTNGAVIKDTAGDAVAFGSLAGFTSQGNGAVAIGNAAGYTGQGTGAVAIGNAAGDTAQSTNTVAIGRSAGYTTQGAGAVAIGYYAGGSEQGVNSVAIGYAAGYNGQAANSIIINATGSVLNQTTANTFTVAPIRNISATSGVLQYNDSTKEVSYSNSVTAETFNTDQITIVGNRISTTVTSANLELDGNGVGGIVINTVAEATTDSTTRAVGYLGLPPANSSISRTLTIIDSGKHTYITTTGVTLTIPAASSVAYPVGTVLTFIAGPSATTVTIAINTDTLRLAGGTSTGTRTLAANGMATAVKVSGTSSSGVWYINGTGLT